MRKVTLETCRAFQNNYPLKRGNTHTDGKALYLHGNKIAEMRADGLWITNAGWSSMTTKERLNGLTGVSINQVRGSWYLNGKKWDGEWCNVQTFEQEGEKLQAKHLKTTAMVAMMGNFFADTQKGKNDWKMRMLKAGLENKGLIMPDDWDSLSEDDKEKRLNGAIGALS